MKLNLPLFRFVGFVNLEACTSIGLSWKGQGEEGGNIKFKGGATCSAVALIFVSGTHGRQLLLAET